MVKKTLLGHDTVAPPSVDGVTQNMGTSNMKGSITLIEDEGRHTDSTPIGCGSHTQVMKESNKNHDEGQKRNMKRRRKNKEKKREIKKGQI